MVYFAGIKKSEMRDIFEEWNIKISQMSVEKLRVLLLKRAVDIVPNNEINCLLPE